MFSTSALKNGSLQISGNCINIQTDKYSINCFMVILTYFLLELRCFSNTTLHGDEPDVKRNQQITESILKRT